MKLFNRKKQVKKSSSWLGNVRITFKLTGLFLALLAGFAVIGMAYYQVLLVEQETLEVSEKMESFESGIQEVQVDLLNARAAITEFYLKKFPILLGKFDTRILFDGIEQIIDKIRLPADCEYFKCRIAFKLHYDYSLAA